MSFRKLQLEAKQRGLILERVRRTYDGVVYRYEVYDNNTFVSDPYCTLQEAAGEILNYKPELNEAMV